MRQRWSNDVAAVIIVMMHCHDTPIESGGPLEQRLAVADAVSRVLHARVALDLHVHERHCFPALVIDAAAARGCARFVRLRLAAGWTEQRLSEGIPAKKKVLNQRRVEPLECSFVEC